MKDMKSKTVVSGIRATGQLHIGNYFGAVVDFVRMQDLHDCYFFIADYHSLTTTPDPKNLAENLPKVALDYLACGLDPERCTLYAQSSAPETAELSLLLSMVAMKGELERVATFKEKAKQNPDNVNLGLLSYPVLMAADILGPKADIVPVGQDQVQHVEFARDFAQRFHHRYGETFPLPVVELRSPVRVPGLDGTGKMGKSDGNTIDLADDEPTIRKKISRAVTDTGSGELTPEAERFFHLFEIVAGAEAAAGFRAERAAGTIRYSEMKQALADAVVTLLAPIQERRRGIIMKKGYLEEILHEGGKKARARISATVKEVRERMGILTF